MDSHQTNRPLNSPIEGIDLDKLSIIFRKNAIWVILLFVACNLGAYLFIRYTKDVYEAESEMKLDIKEDATELGIISYVEEKNMNMVAGEIEQIKSKVFLGHLIDHLDIDISYFSEGQVLVDEMYRRSPYEVSYTLTDPFYYDKPIYIEFNDDQTYSLRINKDGAKIDGEFLKPLKLEGIELTILKKGQEEGNILFFTINSRTNLIEYLAAGVQVEPMVIGANTVRISFRDFNSLKAQTIVNKLDSTYILYSHDQKSMANRQKIDWLDNELVSIEGMMEEFENYFEKFTIQNKSSDMREDLKNTILMINQLDTHRYALNARIRELNSILENFESENPEQKHLTHNFLPASLNQQLLELQKMRQDLSRLGMAYHENTFTYKQKQKEVNAAKDQIHLQLLDLKKNWMADFAEQTKKKDELEKRFATMPDKSTDYAKKQRFYKLYEEFHLSMMQSKAQFEIAQAGSTPDFKILSSATLPSAPIAPQKMIIVGIGLVASIVINIFFVGLLYLFNDKIIGLTEIERSTQIPVLGAIPLTTTKSHSTFHIVDNPRSMVSESIRSLRTNLDFFTSGTDQKVIVVSSTVSGEGKSFLAMNLGGVLSLSHKKVVMLDLDMRKAKRNTSLTATDPSKGISTLLIKKGQWRDCISHTDLKNFDFIPAGPTPPNPAELLMNPEFEQLLTDLKSEYDFVVIDTPPIGLVTDGLMAMKLADLSIYVFRANYSKQDFLNNLKRLVDINKLKHLAIVLNALPTSKRAYGYGYYEDHHVEKSFWQKILRV